MTSITATAASVDRVRHLRALRRKAHAERIAMDIAAVKAHLGGLAQARPGDGLEVHLTKGRKLLSKLEKEARQYR